MSVRTATRISWSIWGLSMTLTALGIFLLVLNYSHPHGRVFAYWAENVFIPLSISTYLDTGGCDILAPSWQPYRVVVLCCRTR